MIGAGPSWSSGVDPRNAEKLCAAATVVIAAIDTTAASNLRE
jgi:hypothetical protein